MPAFTYTDQSKLSLPLATPCDLLVFPFPIPVTIENGSFYKAAISTECDCLLNAVASNLANLKRIKIRSVDEAEARPCSVLSRLIFGDGTTPPWLIIYKDEKSGCQEIWGKDLPVSLVDQLRYAYEENLEISDIVLGSKESWFLQAKRPGGSHILWGGEVPFSKEFSDVMETATVVERVWFTEQGWIIKYDSGSFAWRGLPYRLGERLEDICCNEDLEISVLETGPWQDGSWCIIANEVKTGGRQVFFGNHICKELIERVEKFWNLELFLGPNESYLIRDKEINIPGARSISHIETDAWLSQLCK